MASFTERIELILTASGTQAQKELLATGSAASTLDKATASASAGLAKMGITGSLGMQALKVGTVAAAAGVAKFALDGVQQFADLTGSVRQFQRVSLATAEDSSKLVFAAKELGVETDALASTTGRFLKNVGSGKVDLEQYGIQLVKNKDGSIDTANTMLNVVDSFNKQKDAAARATEGNALFGKGWQTLLPLLSKNKEELKAFFDEAANTHQVFSQSELDKGYQLQQSLKELKATFEGLSVELGSALVPAITQTTKLLSEMLQITDQLGVTGIAAGAAFGAGIGMMVGGPFGAAIGGAAGGVVAAQGQGGIVGDIAKGFSFLPNAVGDLFGSSNAPDLGSSTKDQKDAQKKVADLAIQGKQDTQAYADAVDKLTTASGNLTTAQKAVASTTETTSQKMQIAADAAISEKLATDQLVGGALSLVAASNNVVTSQHQAAAAHDAVTKAQTALNDAIDQYGASSQQASDAQLALTAAQDGATSADLSQVQSASQLNTVFDNMKKSMIDHGQSITDVVAKIRDLETQYPALTPLIEGYITQLATVNATMAAAQDKTVTMTVNVVTAGLQGLSALANADVFSPETRQYLHDLGVQGYATGGHVGGYATGGPVRVGENGPELFVPDTPGTIVPNAGPFASSGGSGGGPQIIQLVVDGQVLAQVAADQFNRAGGPKISSGALV